MQHVQQTSTCYKLCGKGHMSGICPTNPESLYYVGQQSRDTQNQYRPQGNYNQPQKPPQQVEESTNDLLKKLLLKNQQLRIDFRNLERQVEQLASIQNTRHACTLPSDTGKNPQVNTVTLKNERELEETPKKRRDKPISEGELIPKATHESKKDNASSEPVSATRPPPPFPQRLQKKNDDRMFNKFLSMLSQVQLNIPLVDAIHEIPKYAKYIKDIVAHKRRLTEFETVTLTEECTSRVQNKLPQKLKDPGSFTIPVQIGNIDVGHALCYLGASINLMPLSLFKQLGLGAPRPTTVMLQLADRSIAYPEGVIEDVLLQIGRFIFLADLIILDYEADEQVPIILGRPLLATGDAIIKVREGKIIMRVDNEEAVFNIYKTIQLLRHYEEISMISIVEVDEQLIDPSVYLDDSLEKALMLFDSLETDDEVEEIMHILDASCVYMQELNTFEPLNRPSGPPPKSSIEEAPKLELKPLPPHIQYAYLVEQTLLRVLREHKQAYEWTMSDIRGISPAFYMHKILMKEGHKPSIKHKCRLNPIMKEVIVIAPEDQEKTTFTRPYGTCEETKLVLNWRSAISWYEKVDKAKVEAIEKFPPPTSVKGICSFLGHTGFYRRFIKEFSKNSSPLCRLLEKDIPSKFDDACLRAFEELKKRLVTVPIIIAPGWAHPFKSMCDASDVAIGAVLGQRRDKIFHSIYYASQTLNQAQMNYTVTKKELLAVVWAFDKFRSYVVGTKVIVYTDHSAIRYMFEKRDAKPRLIRWVLLFQEFDLEIRDRKGTENQVADHLSRLENRKHVAEGGSIKETFKDE
ncbi:uncharacterized protein [Nicotiana tomentosiformis]|uniref:uncharacterized protein n=1 Tax=Nicotiana tomentosiformis TaxID=4098 RepID=UPI00388C4B38